MAPRANHPSGRTGLAVLSLLACLAGAAHAADGAAPAMTKAAPLVPPTVSVQAIIDGQVYADAAGLTLYVNDASAKASGDKKACRAPCLGDWKPLPAPVLARRIGDWDVVDRDDGTRQWSFQGKPVFSYAGDFKAGDLNGDGRTADGAAWHALVISREYRPPGVNIRTLPYSDLGPSFATADGRTLYLAFQFRYNAAGATRYNNLPPAPDVCVEECTKTWIPFAAPDDAKPEGLWSVVKRLDGSSQWAYRKFPLYTYAKDSGPDDALGEAIYHIQNGITGVFWEVATVLP